MTISGKQLEAKYKKELVYQPANLIVSRGLRREGEPSRSKKEIPIIAIVVRGEGGTPASLTSIKNLNCDKLILNEPARGNFKGDG